MTLRSTPLPKMSTLHLSSPPPEMEYYDILPTPATSHAQAPLLPDNLANPLTPIVPSNTDATLHITSPTFGQGAGTNGQTPKRRAQNRVAQRKFRERKERYIKELEERVKQLEEAQKRHNEELEKENEKLKSIVQRLETEFNRSDGTTKTPLVIESSLSQLPSPVAETYASSTSISTSSIIQATDSLEGRNENQDAIEISPATPLQSQPEFKMSNSPYLFDGTKKRVPTCDIIEAINAIKRQPGETEYEANWKNAIRSYLDNNLIDLEDLCRMVFKVNCEKKRKYVSEIVQERLKVARLS